MPRPGTFARVAQPDFSATSSRTPLNRSGIKTEAPVGSWSPTSSLPLDFQGACLLLNSSSWNSRGSRPASCAISSMKDCETQQYALSPGARIAPQRSMSGCADVYSAYAGANPEGYVSDPMPPPGAL